MRKCDWVSLATGASSALLTAAVLLAARAAGSPVQWFICAAAAATAGAAAGAGPSVFGRVLQKAVRGAPAPVAGPGPDQAVKMRRRLVELEREHVESILAQVGDAVLVTDAANQLVSANAHAAHALNLSLPQAVGRPIAQVIHEPALLKLFEQARQGGAGGPLRGEVSLSQAAGRFEVTAVRLSGDDEGVAGVAAVMHDASRNARYAELRDDFISHVSHELRTPLASIKAYIELLIDGEVEDDRVRAEFYGIIHNETNRLARLVENILTINRIETGLAKVDRQRLSLGDVVRQVARALQPAMLTKRIRLKVDCPEAGPFIEADHDLIFAAVRNLVSNAVKYSQPGAEVRVAVVCDASSRMATLRVSDGGAGIPADDLPRVFDKFYRAAVHRQLAQGTGLGLSLVKLVVEQVHGGEVSVRSEPGKGSDFVVALPLMEDGR